MEFNIRNKIRNLLKKSNILYSIYFYIFSTVLKILGVFIKTDKNLILFVSYSGRKFDDSPKVLYEYMKKNKEYAKYKFIWAFEDVSIFKEVPEDEKIKIDSFKYWFIALKAGFWITNSSITRGLNFKKKNTKYIIFQHGTVGIKRLGKDIKKSNKSFRIKKEENIDLFIIQGKKEKKILENCLNIKGKIREWGLPRNDELQKVDFNKVVECRKKIGIPLDKKVILYAPTFREFYNDSSLNTIIKVPFDSKNMMNRLGNEYVLVITGHYEISKMLNINEDGKRIINAFKYPHINDLLIASDILISDYSSVVFDYVILEKPVLCYGYDYDLYMRERGTYLDLNKLFYDGVIKSQLKLEETIKNMNYEDECNHSRKIKKIYINNVENSVKRAAEQIFLD